MRAHRINFDTGEIETWEWEEGKRVAIVVELRDGDIENIANMVPTATLYAVYGDDVSTDDAFQKLDELKERPGAYRRDAEDGES